MSENAGFFYNFRQFFTCLTTFPTGNVSTFMKKEIFGNQYGPCNRMRYRNEVLHGSYMDHTWVIPQNVPKSEFLIKRNPFCCSIYPAAH